MLYSAFPPVCEPIQCSVALSSPDWTTAMCFRFLSFLVQSKFLQIQDVLSLDRDVSWVGHIILLV